jgi:hypothetical protein
MKKIIPLLICILVIVAITGVSFAAKPDPITPDKADPFATLWATIGDLQDQIDDIELLPGPQGPQGEQGPAGQDGADGATVHLGEWSDASTYQLDTLYTASTDGFVCVYCTFGSLLPTEVRVYGFTPADVGNMKARTALTINPNLTDQGFMMPVRSGDTWKVEAWGVVDAIDAMGYRIYWLPLSG